LWEALGAHVRTSDGEIGVSFSVWAPNATAVRVVGDHNDWNGEAHAMRSMGVSGVWEIFIPGLPVGTRYKYQIRTRDGAW
ncbi:1,4-alpha-glucan branching enzyme, partial [Mycobacterium tuberculosis]|nr:1,4-alpha-glucan branching enzyme [Mycobacterium tuberculosis]